MLEAFGTLGYHGRTGSLVLKLVERIGQATSLLPHSGVSLTHGLGTCPDLPSPDLPRPPQISPDLPTSAAFFADPPPPLLAHSPPPRRALPPPRPHQDHHAHRRLRPPPRPHRRRHPPLVLRRARLRRRRHRDAQEHATRPRRAVRHRRPTHPHDVPLGTMRPAGV